MKVYILILSSIISREDDLKFGKIIQKYRYDWWRYTPLNWIIAVPSDDSKANLNIFNAAKSTYQTNPIYLLEVNITGYMSSDVPVFFNSHVVYPSSWFEKIKDPNYLPPWKTDIRIEGRILNAILNGTTVLLRVESTIGREVTVKFNIDEFPVDVTKISNLIGKKCKYYPISIPPQTEFVVDEIIMESELPNGK